MQNGADDRHRAVALDRDVDHPPRHAQLLGQLARVQLKLEHPARGGDDPPRIDGEPLPVDQRVCQC